MGGAALPPAWDGPESSQATAALPDEDDHSAHPSSVLGKAQLLLSAFDRTRPTLGLTVLSRRSGVSKATTYRLAEELVRLCLLERKDDGYQLGWRMFELGQLAPGPANLRHIARPALMDLHAATKAVIHLSVRHKGTTLYLERLAGRRDPRIHAAGGARIPLWFTASGKLFMAYSSDAELTLAEIESSGILPPTRHSVRRADQLRPQLPMIRDRRCAEEREECLEGYKTHAVPITLGSPDNVVAAVSATLDVKRSDDQNVTRTLRAAAADISRSLQRADAQTLGID